MVWLSRELAVLMQTKLTLVVAGELAMTPSRQARLAARDLGLPALRRPLRRRQHRNGRRLQLEGGLTRATQAWSAVRMIPAHPFGVEMAKLSMSTLAVAAVGIVVALTAGAVAGHLSPAGRPS